MKPIDVNSPETKSTDLAGSNVEALRALFPEAFTEGRIDFEVLKQLLGGAVDEREEKYGLNWHGKRQARQLALTPSTGTLRPAPEDSVDWDTTQNLMIEGDNLEVLKLLQKSYAGKVKMIYIDPPYNTGGDFVYKDDFQDNIKNYLKISNQVGPEGYKVSSNSESSGRFHTEWLNMMYPRLKLAYNLLQSDGVIFVSLDDGELSNLRKVCDEVFGEENFLQQIIWKKRSTPPNDQVLGANHDYIVVYAKDKQQVGLNLRGRSQEQIDRYKNPDNHPKGVWTSGDLMANVKGGRYVESLYFGIRNPNTGEEHYPSSHGNWRFNRTTIADLLANDEIYFGADGKSRPKLKRFLAEVKDGITYPTIWDFVPLNTEGSSEIASALGTMTIFENPKPRGLIRELVKLGSSPGDTVLDFFAGSGTTGDAVLHENTEHREPRQFILVQLPEPIKREGFNKISDITEERLRRSSKTLRGTSLFGADLGFRVFKLDSTNIRPWEPNRDKLTETLEESVEHIKAGRSEQDVLYEVLLKLGLELTVPMETRVIADKTAYSVGAGALLVCLAEAIAATEVESLALGIVEWHHALAPAVETAVVFRDSAFADDVAKTNLTAILTQHGLENVRSL